MNRHSRWYWPNAPSATSVTTTTQRDRVGQEMAVALVLEVEVTLEAEPEGEEVCERDQQPIDHQLGKRVTMDGEGRGSDPSAHAARILVAGCVKNC